MESFVDYVKEFSTGVYTRMQSMHNDQRGVAVYFIRALIALIICGVVWYAGNVILFDSENGIVPLTDNMSDATETYFGDISGGVEWFWSIFPFIIMMGAAVYVIYGALRKEPYRV